MVLSDVAHFVDYDGFSVEVFVVGTLVGSVFGCIFRSFTGNISLNFDLLHGNLAWKRKKCEIKKISLKYFFSSFLPFSLRIGIAPAVDWVANMVELQCDYFDGFFNAVNSR